MVASVKQYLLKDGVRNSKGPFLACLCSLALTLRVPLHSRHSPYPCSPTLLSRVSRVRVSVFNSVHSSFSEQVISPPVASVDVVSPPQRAYHCSQLVSSQIFSLLQYFFLSVCLLLSSLLFEESAKGTD